MFAKAAVDQNFFPYWGTEAEDHFLSKLAANPQDAYLWNRLGNFFDKQDRPDLAVAVLEHSLRVDEAQMESNFTLGRILYECEIWDEAAGYLRRTLVYASDYDKLPAEKLRDMLSYALELAMEIHAITDGRTPFLPTSEELQLARRKDATADLSDRRYLTTLELDVRPDDPKTWLAVAEFFMGKTREQLPPEKRTLVLPATAGKIVSFPGRAPSAFPAPKVNKQKPQKKKPGEKR